MINNMTGQRTFCLIPKFKVDWLTNLETEQHIQSDKVKQAENKMMI